MINLGLRHSELKKLKTLLTENHRIIVHVSLMDLSHKHERDCSDMLLGGQVTLDATASEATRSLTMELLDPDRRLRLDGNAPTDGSVYFSRMFRVIYIVESVDRSERYRIPIFTGPITKVDRNGPVLSIEAQGKEKLSMSVVWKGRTFKQGQRKTYVLKEILTDLAGESKKYISLKPRKSKLPKKLSISREVTPWQVATRVARMMNLQLFYNGWGIATLRRKPGKTSFVFRTDEGILSNVQVTFDANEVVNAVEVEGGKPKGAKKKVRYRVVAPRAHPLSPWSMGRFGNPRYLPEMIQDDSIKTIKEARTVAKDRLRNRLIESVDVAFDSLPVPFLEENDLCRVVSEDFTGSFRLRQMTIPLTADGVSSIGYLKRVTPNKRQKRLRNNKRGKGRNAA